MVTDFLPEREGERGGGKEDEREGMREGEKKDGWREKEREGG